MPFITYMQFLCLALVMGFFTACGDSIDADGQAVVEESSSSDYPESFKPDDKDYPYAGISRIVIETEGRQKIKNRETEIPAKMQIWGDTTVESEILDLTIRGRGNTSWNEMPKKSYKIEFEKKQSMFGMPKDKDWILIANYADKTLMRNYVAYRLSGALGAYYAPRCEFAELYLNGEYLGVYLLVESIKIAKNRVDIPKDENSYIVEFDAKYRNYEQFFFSDVITDDGKGKAFRVHNPKDANDSILKTVQKHVENFEKYLKTVKTTGNNKLDDWIDIDESIKHYWVQEFTKNPDGYFTTSVYFSWIQGEKIKMGPVWDFDLAYGNHSYENFNLTEKWHVRNYWNYYLFKDSLYEKNTVQKWKDNIHLFESVLDSIDNVSLKLKSAARNNFKRWDILGESGHWLRKPYESYEEAVNDLKDWIKKRTEWIESQLSTDEK